MKIRRLEMRNFRSLRQVIMDELGDLVTVIGKNGSGKSGLVEALAYFFHEFDARLETPCTVPDRRLWYCFDATEPIQFRLTLDVSDDEQQAIAPPPILEMWRSENDSHTLGLTRHIAMTGDGAVWRTMEVKLGQRYLVEKGKLTSEGAKAGVEPPPVEPSAPPPADARPEGDQPQQVQPDEPRASPTNEDAIELGDDASGFLSNLSRRLKDTLRVIPAVRSTPASAAPPLGAREPFINREMQQGLIELHDSSAEDTIATAKLAQIQRLVEKVLQERWQERWRLDFVGHEVYLFEGDLLVPISLTGGGHQEYLAFVQRLLEEGRIFAIEEPESHLHHTLCRELFRLMREIAEERQIILVTHSEHFLDFAQPNANWIFQKDGKQTKAVRAQSDEQLVSAMGGVGAQPADRLFPNSLLLVAGETEEAVVPIWLHKMGSPTGLGGVEVSAFQGESDWRKAAARIEAYQGTQTRLFLMVDDHGDHLAKKAQQLGLPAHHCLVLDGTIEDTYPLDKLSAAMEHLYGKRNMEELHFEPEIPRAEDVQSILKERLGILKRNTTWKRGLGQEVANRMSAHEIPEEVKDFLANLAE